MVPLMTGQVAQGSILPNETNIKYKAHAMMSGWYTRIKKDRTS
jgi:hypothetical protein